MADDVSDAQLVERVQRGERAAFDLLVRKYQHRVVNLVSRYVNPSEAQDVAQDAFIKAYRSLSGFKGDSAFYTWLYRISINAAKNHITARSRRPSNQDIDVDDAEVIGRTDRFSDRASPEALAESDETRDTVLATIRELPEDLRMAIMLRELDGMSYDEIAETMDCPVGTVRSRIFRARSAVEERIAALSEK
ncbi:RNA polymerase sigma factor RpoE [Salinisphaera sp. USBA-960]|uniref:RNA polymerase sigma factor RpoE n=1 Tax=Salinisphaera orenii TaxID=856731 RepID=UPI000DBEA249|nr:RNA polymerase sigma factor RpoE [Salifodinibacter halophilus]NNC26074.1 RNA polymerase sigma factor RpoE [Salifodinibacter halophilus]